MFVDCLCPTPTALTEIPDLACSENIGQVVKLAFQLKQSSPSFPTKVGSGSGDAGILESWTDKIESSGIDKIIITPFCENVIIPPVDAISEGGDDNSTLDGLPMVIGATIVNVTGQFRSIPANIVTELKRLNCYFSLTVYLINEFGYIFGTSPDGFGLSGIEIADFFLSDGGSQGKNSHDKIPFRWIYRYGWRDKLAIVKPTNFNGRDLVAVGVEGVFDSSFDITFE